MKALIISLILIIFSQKSIAQNSEFNTQNSQNDCHYTGVVKFFNDAKGFGSIVPEMGGIDLNVHISGLIDQIAEGHRVKFCIEDKSGVKYATHVTVI